MYNSEEHYIGVRSLTTTNAVVEIASTPTQVDLAIGEETKKDLDDDGYYDVSITLNGIVNNKADLTINYIHEAVSAGTTTNEEQPAGTTGEEETTTAETQWPVWLWIVIGVIVLVVIGGGIALNKKKK